MSARPLHERSTVCALVPHFACERWLGQAIESLLEQTRPPQAIVVIDDGSDEPPVDVVRAYPDVTLLAADDNGGPYRLVQAVIDRSDFDGYLFQDADDWSAPDRLEALLDEAAATGAELVGSHEVRVLVTEGDIVPVTYPRDVNEVLRSRSTAFPLLHPTSIIGGDLVRRLGGFATGMRFSGDAELLRRAAHVARVVNADHFGYFRRKRPGSLTLGSDTALGSPARQEVQDILAARARDNAERVSAGLAPDLRPWRSATPPTLRHLAGPGLERAGRAGPGPARAARRPQRVACDDPVFVVGAPRSGHSIVALGLGQHPDLALLHDSRWLARTAADIELRALEQAAPVPAGFRERLAAALGSLATTTVGRRPVIAGTEPLAAGHALATAFPAATFVHVVRDPIDLTRALVGAPTADGAFYTADGAWCAWVAAAEAGLALEAALGADRVLRIHYDDLVADGAAVAARCLGHLGLSPDAACVRPMTELGTAHELDAPPPPSSLADRVTALQRTLERTAPPSDPTPEAREALTERFRRDWADSRPGTSIVERMRALVTGAVPDGAIVAVVSRGDPRLVELGGRVGWHLPQVEDGVYAGHHPADSDDAVAQLDAVQARGAEYLAVPASGLWWLTYYDGLRRRLEETSTLVAFHHEIGAVFHLAVASRPSIDDAPAAPRFVPAPTLSEVR